LAVIAVAISRMMAARSNPVLRPHSPLNAARAAATAWSMPSGPPSAMIAHDWPVYGLTDLKVFPETASTFLPLQFERLEVGDGAGHGGPPDR
jgi:hypothetical protein